MKKNKSRIWVTISEESEEFLDWEITKKRFYNYSHVVDFIVTEFIKRERERQAS